MSEFQGTNQPTDNLEVSYHQVMQKIADAARPSGRRASDIMVVAVTENASLQQICQLANLGHQDFGESQIAQLVARMNQIDKEIQNAQENSNATKPEHPANHKPLRWHLTGSLPRTKVNQVIGKTALFHCADSLRIIEQLHNSASQTQDVIDILLKVNASDQLLKHCLPLPAVIHVAEQVNTMFHLRLRGITATVPDNADQKETQWLFARTKELFAELKTKRFAGDKCNILSMGTDHNFELAIEQGANMVCVGSKIFG